MQAEGSGDAVIEEEDVRAYQNRLRTEGFNAVELEAARAIGMSAEETAASSHARIKVAPARGRFLEGLRSSSMALRGLGTVLKKYDMELIFQTENRDISTKLARVFSSFIDIPVENPFDYPVTIELHARRVGVAPDWVLTVDPVAAHHAVDSRRGRKARIELGDGSHGVPLFYATRRLG
ncbi:hypothetical protein SAMN05444745_11119 [Arthrobacter sp. OV608]|nr:hypothetical protein SAMN05444745_11119 [Arthrobacter sp. OV608]